MPSAGPGEALNRCGFDASATNHHGLGCPREVCIGALSFDVASVPTGAEADQAGGTVALSLAMDFPQVANAGGADGTPGMRLCCSAPSGSDCVEQPAAGRLAVTAPTSAHVFSRVVPQGASRAVPTDITLVVPPDNPQLEEGAVCYFSAVGCTPSGCTAHGVPVFGGVVRVAVDLPPTSAVPLCCRMAGATDCVEQASRC